MIYPVLSQRSACGVMRAKTRTSAASVRSLGVTAGRHERTGFPVQYAEDAGWYRIERGVLFSFSFFLSFLSFFFFFLLRGVREGCAYLGKSVVCYSGEMLHKVQKILHTIFLAL